MGRRYSDCGLRRFGKVGCIRYLSSKNQRERNIDQTKNDQFLFPFADGKAKLSGRDYKFRKRTPRREQTVRSEDCSGELVSCKQNMKERSTPNEFAQIWLVWSGLPCESSPVRPRWSVVSSSGFREAGSRFSGSVNGRSSSSCRAPPHDAQVVTIPGSDVDWAERVVAC